MNSDMIQRLLTISAGGLTAGGLIMLAAMLLGGVGEWLLAGGLLCLALAGLMNTLRIQQRKNHSNGGQNK